MMATTLMGMLAMTGVAIDYSRVLSAQTVLQHAVDSAALALANAQVLDQMRPDRDARRFVAANLSDRSPLTLGAVDVVQREGGYAYVTATATQQTFMLGLAGISEWALAADAEAQFNEPDDVDIFVLLDNSPSMLLGATQADMAGISLISRRLGAGNCAFACHYSGRDTYTPAHAEGWDTRLDAAKAALNNAVRLGVESMEAQNADIYFKVKTFTATYGDPEGAGEIEGKATELSATRLIDRIAPIQRPSDQFLQSDQELALAAAANEVAQRRRRHSDRMPFMIMLTDGVTNMRRGGRVVQPVDPAWCERIKSQGVRLGVIYTTYFDIPSNHAWRRYVRRHRNDIGPNLRECASPGWFFEAQYANDINDAFEKLMQAALPKPRLTE